MQIYSQDFNKTFTLIIHINLLRILIAIIVVKNIEAEQVDINNTFTKSKL
jgi:uncharacterized integral membrane protein